MPCVAAAEKAGTPDVYVYDELPPFLRAQISEIFQEFIDASDRSLYDISRIMAREIPAFYYMTRDHIPRKDCINYLMSSDDVDGVLSLIEMCAQAMAEELPYGDADPAEGLVELNQRFLQHGVGYQFENGQIIRVDSRYVHAEIVKEAVRLLYEPEFEKANDEFMTAHRHLREGKLRDCNTASLRAIENVLKVICDARGWRYQKKDTVERLLAIVQSKGSSQTIWWRTGTSGTSSAP